MVDEIVKRFSTGNFMWLDVEGIIGDRPQKIVHLVPTMDAQRYAIEFTDQPPMAEPLANPANAYRHPNVALALANNSVWENAQEYPQCRYPTHRLIHYPNRSALGPAAPSPSGMPEKGEEALVRLGRTSQPTVCHADNRCSMENCTPIVGSKRGADQARSTTTNDDQRRSTTTNCFALANGHDAVLTLVFTRRCGRPAAIRA